MEQTNLIQSSSTETKQKQSEKATDEAKPKKPRKSRAERIREKKNELKKLEKMAEEGKRNALVRILYKNGIHTETELQAVLKKAGCTVVDEEK